MMGMVLLVNRSPRFLIRIMMKSMAMHPSAYRARMRSRWRCRWPDDP
jgi:hypothetical protein